MQDQARSALTKALQLEEVYDFSGAKTIYQEILDHTDDEPTLEKARWRMEDMDDLIAEKNIYRRIDENAKRVLTEIGVNIAENQTLMDILMEADAIDFDNETAIFIPLKPDYIDHCLAQMPQINDSVIEAIGRGEMIP